MTITRVGTNQQYATGWDAAFSKKGTAKASSSQKKAAPSKKSAGKKTAKKGKK